MVVADVPDVADVVLDVDAAVPTLRNLFFVMVIWNMEYGIWNMEYGTGLDDLDLFQIIMK